MKTVTGPANNEEDAFHAIVQCLRCSESKKYADYGYELYLPKVIEEYLEPLRKMAPHDVYAVQRAIPEYSPAFRAAAWNLCRRGVLRPGTRIHGGQTTDEGSGGSGYSLTPTGKEWLSRASHYDFVPVDPGRFSQLLDKFSARFGPGFVERSQDAIRCYSATAYLACCAMCGAAAESIMLSLAIAKSKDEQRTMAEYVSASGRSKIEKALLGQQPEHIRREFLGYGSLLKYWRDYAAHGRQSGIGDGEAYTSLAMLLRLAQFASEHWGDLTK
ncbi:MAG: hypothetical protein HY078_12630 [Elusimicrobia bacterium]|nr:hypothetical protein [Elusimicrobiota bacterium]